jgi:hypothetical protein
MLCSAVTTAGEARCRLAVGFAAAAPLSTGLGFGTVGTGGSDEPRELSRSPHLLFIVLHDRGPPATYWAGLPDQGAVKDPVGLWANR